MKQRRLSRISEAEPLGDTSEPSVNITHSLREASREVVAEYLGGRWPEVYGSSWGELRAFLLNELLRRCPGFSTREYRTALMTRLVVRTLTLKKVG